MGNVKRRNKNQQKFKKNTNNLTKNFKLQVNQFQRAILFNSKMIQSLLEVRKNGKTGLKISTIGVMVRLKLLTPGFHTNLHLSKLRRRTIQSLSEEKRNGKHGHKILTTGVTVKQMLPTPESHINLLSNSKPPTTQLRLEARKNGKDGLRTLMTGVMVKQTLPTLESHTNQHSFP